MLDLAKVIIAIIILIGIYILSPFLFYAMGAIMLAIVIVGLLMFWIIGD